MVHFRELIARIKTQYRFDRQEVTGLAAAVIVTAFIFSFRDWGVDEFNLLQGITHFSLIIIIAVISFVFRYSCGKLYALKEGYKPFFTVWWMGLGIALLVAFITVGRIPLILIGGVVPAFLIKHRLGEFRHGFSYWHNAMISYWGILGNLIIAILFAVGHLFLPQSYFFTKGVQLNIIMAACSIIPLPQLDGLNIFFGSKGLYFLALILLGLAAVLLIPNTVWGLVAAAILLIVYAAVTLSIDSEK